MLLQQVEPLDLHEQVAGLGLSVVLHQVGDQLCGEGHQLTAPPLGGRLVRAVGGLGRLAPLGGDVSGQVSDGSRGRRGSHVSREAAHQVPDSDWVGRPSMSDTQCREGRMQRRPVEYHAI